MVSNPRSTQMQVELRPYDPGNNCRFEINTPKLSVPPLSQLMARLNVVPRSSLLADETRRACTFTVAAYTEGLPNPEIVEGSLLLVHGFTWRSLLPFLVGAVILLGLGGLAVIVLLFINYVR
jgi:hypothetical protein